jgi:two-component system, OmpR family, alkaline phosphatase synthesis response regulator PhoP
MAFKIVIADDEPLIVNLLSYNLKEAGYQVVEAENGLEAMQAIHEHKPDLILLDIMMPVMSGIEVALKLNEQDNEIPFIFLTAKSDEETEIQCFELGAYDFMAKPIKPKVFLSRINAFFKKEFETNLSQESTEISVNGLHVNKQTYTVTLENENTLKLPKKEFELLYFMMQKPDKVHSRNDLLNAIWGIDIFVVDRTVDVHIRKIREKIGEGYIETLKGIGYLFSTKSRI